MSLNSANYLNQHNIQPDSIFSKNQHGNFEGSITIEGFVDGSPVERVFHFTLNERSSEAQSSGFKYDIIESSGKIDKRVGSGFMESSKYGEGSYISFSAKLNHRLGYGLVRFNGNFLEDGNLAITISSHTGGN